jgi:hypothetical protein
MGAFVVFFCLLVPSSYSQNGILDEMDKMSGGKSVSKDLPIPLKSMLPDIFSGRPMNAYIGISDPGADSATAMEQAYLRALCMYNLSNGTGRGISDYFTLSEGGSITNNYEEMCELHANTKLSASALSISDQIRLNTGEMVLLLKVDNAKSKRDDLLELQSNISLYFKETGSGASMRSESKTILENECLPSGRPGGHRERLNNVSIDNRWINRDTQFDAKIIDNTRYKTYYLSDNKCDETQTGSNSGAQNTYEGLWYAFINSTFRQLALQLKQQFQKEKSLGENYVSRQANLSRDAGFVRFECRVNSLYFCDNHLYVDMTTNFPTTNKKQTL